jgi:hypothetical protein
MAEILLHSIGHGHAQGSGKVSLGHRLLFFGIFQKSNQAVGQVSCISWAIEFNGELFAIRHFAKVGEIGAYDRHSVSACQMGDATASRR